MRAREGGPSHGDLSISQGIRLKGLRRVWLVWTYLPTWVVQDGEVPELAVGDRLGDVGSSVELRPSHHRIRTGR